MKGAFTGALKDKIGKFEAADQGTIFLDEIGTMPMHLQTKLLRVLQEQEVERVGSNRPIKLDVRVISATNQNLEEEVKAGNFRDDLYYRLNVIPLIIPPLRERVEDILPLVNSFLQKNCREMKRPLMSLTREALEALELYHWPGNVRELENVVERTVALTEGNQITFDDLPSAIRMSASTRVVERGVDLVKTVSDIERKMITDALALSNGVKAKAAVLLKLNRTTLVEKMRRLGMYNNSQTLLSGDNRVSPKQPSFAETIKFPLRNYNIGSEHRDSKVFTKGPPSAPPPHLSYNRQFVRLFHAPAKGLFWINHSEKGLLQK